MRKDIVLISLAAVSLGEAVVRSMEAHKVLASCTKDLDHPRYQDQPKSPKRKFKKGSKK